MTVFGKWWVIVQGIVNDFAADYEFKSDYVEQEITE
jgi:hypothetical protein